LKEIGQLGQRDIAPRWGAGPREPLLSTNIPPRWGGKDFFTPFEVVAIFVVGIFVVGIVVVGIVVISNHHWER
jgi:hypothetical protein